MMTQLVMSISGLLILRLLRAIYFERPTELACIYIIFVRYVNGWTISLDAGGPDHGVAGWTKAPAADAAGAFVSDQRVSGAGRAGSSCAYFVSGMSPRLTSLAVTMPSMVLVAKPGAAMLSV